MGDAGADMFLAKPFEMEALLALAARYIGNEEHLEQKQQQ